MPRLSGLPAAAWVITGISTTIAFGLLVVVGGSIEPIGFLWALSLIGILCCLCWIYGNVRRDAILGPLLNALTVVIWSGMMAGLTSLMALRRNTTLIDPWLASIDEKFYCSAEKFTIWIASQDERLMTVLKCAYESSFPLLMISIIYLSISKRKNQLWILCFSFTTLIVFCATVSAFVPAAGAFSYYHIQQPILDRLPIGAGLYHLPVFNAFRSGQTSTVNFRALQGVVTFPSFHTALALMSAYSLRGIRGLALPSAIWSSIVIVSTIPIGGHYFVDIAAAYVLWILTVAAAHRLTVQSPQVQRRALISRLETQSLSIECRLTSCEMSSGPSLDQPLNFEVGATLATRVLSHPENIGGSTEVT